MIKHIFLLLLPINIAKFIWFWEQTPPTYFQHFSLSWIKSQHCDLISWRSVSFSWPMCFFDLYVSVPLQIYKQRIATKARKKKKTSLCHREDSRSLSFVLFSPVIFSCNTNECCSASVFLSSHESLNLSHHPWLHGIYPWGPIDRLQQPFNEISSVLLEKRNAVQSNR